MLRGCIQLNQCTPIASGNNRDVFAHPDDPALLIKTIKPDAYARRAARGARWTTHCFRRYKQYLSFLRECQEHIVSRLHPDGIPDFVHAVVGFVDTDRGLGLVFRAERDRSGAYAKTLANLIAEGLYDEEARQALDRFTCSFLASSVIVTDLGTKNLVYAYDVDHGQHFVLIDGYGEKNFIPINSLFKWFHRRTQRKRVMRLGKAIARAIRQRDEARRTGGR
jgi:hypothetical protein